MAFEELSRPLNLMEADIVRAMESREATKELLDRLAAISRPDTGAAKSLLVLARMATTACEWLDGDLRVEIVGDADVSVFEVLEEMGMGMRERVFAPIPFDVPLAEFAAAVARVPRMIAPLSVIAKSERRLVLGATAEIRKSTLPPAPLKISDESFFVPKAPAAPAAERIEERRAPPLPVIAAGLPVVDARSSAHVKVAKPAVPPPAPKKKSTRPPAKKSTKPPAGAKKSSKPPKGIDEGWDD